MKHLTSKICCVLFLFSCTLVANAQTFIVDGISYIITENSDNKYCKVSKGNEQLSNVVIPDSVLYSGQNEYYTVTGIGDKAFLGCSGLTSITIPDSVTSIGESAFDLCSGLTSIIIPESVAVIGNDAFCSTGLTSIQLPENITSIGDNAFFSCYDLATVTIPDSAKITSIGKSVFFGCHSLKSFAIPNNVVSIGDHAFYGCSNLTSVIIPTSVDSIGRSAFEGCSNLTAITIPNKVKSIGISAFDGCYGLTSVSIPESVEKIGDGAFWGCRSLTSVVINGTPELTVNPFGSCPNITSFAYKGYFSLKEILGDEKVTELTDVTLLDSTTQIAPLALLGCSSLTSINIPESVTSIGDSAFYDCSQLTSLVIPEKVENIGNEILTGCTNLDSIYCFSITPPVCKEYAFNGLDKQSVMLRVPHGTVDAYAAAVGWCDFFNIEADDFASAITNVEMKNNNQPESIYSLDGRKLPVLQKGVNIVRMSNGKTMRVLMK